MSRPILFSTPMVRAILEGRKTQTRRVIKPQPEPAVLPGVYWYKGRQSNLSSPFSPIMGQCPYGQPGDQLWVREAWNLCQREFLVDGEAFTTNPFSKGNGAVYRAGGYERHPDKPEYGESRWRPSIHMPRWASRITLEVVNVRVERLQDISEEDARAEGVNPYGGMCPAASKYYYGFVQLWESINAKRGHSWTSNPFVWVLEFRRVEA